MYEAFQNRVLQIILYSPVCSAYGQTLKTLQMLFCAFAGIFGNVIADRTVCMNARQANHLHYNVHSLYGWSQTLVTLE